MLRNCCLHRSRDARSPITSVFSVGIRFSHVGRNVLWCARLLLPRVTLEHAVRVHLAFSSLVQPIAPVARAVLSALRREYRLGVRRSDRRPDRAAPQSADNANPSTPVASNQSQDAIEVALHAQIRAAQVGEQHRDCLARYSPQSRQGRSVPARPRLLQPSRHVRLGPRMRNDSALLNCPLSTRNALKQGHTLL